jgi:hypothetical protein
LHAIIETTENELNLPVYVKIVVCKFHAVIEATEDELNLPVYVKIVVAFSYPSLADIDEHQ